MGRIPRFLPHSGCLVEITQRTLQGRHLLTPSPRLNQLFIGTLAKSQRQSSMQIQAIAVMSNHFHLLITPQSVEQMAEFMGHFKTNLSKEVGRLRDWPGPMFEGRYRAIPVSDEPEAQIARLEYLLAQGCKEGLVASPFDWPGVQSASALAEGVPLEGQWIDRRSLGAAGRRASESEFAETLKVSLTPLPCWRHLSSAARQERTKEVIQRIEMDTRLMHRRAGSQPAGGAAISRTPPHRRSELLERRPAPRFHAWRRRIRQQLLVGLRQFLVEYRRASSLLRAGALSVDFPPGCFPPRRPFVATTEYFDSG